LRQNRRAHGFVIINKIKRHTGTAIFSELATIVSEVEAALIVNGKAIAAKTAAAPNALPIIPLLSKSQMASPTASIAERTNKTPPDSRRKHREGKNFFEAYHPRARLW